MDLRNRIKDLCAKQGISMNKLEDTLNFGKGYLSKLDNSTPNIAKLRKIADYFGVSLDYLMGLSKTMVPIETTEGLSHDYIKVISKAKSEGFTPEDIELALDMLKMARSAK